MHSQPTSLVEVPAQATLPGAVVDKAARLLLAVNELVMTRTNIADGLLDGEVCGVAYELWSALYGGTDDLDDDEYDRDPRMVESFATGYEGAARILRAEINHIDYRWLGIGEGKLESYVRELDAQAAATRAAGSISA